MKILFTLFIAIMTYTTQIMIANAAPVSACPCKYPDIITKLKNDGVTLSSVNCMITYNRNSSTPTNTKPGVVNDIDMRLVLAGQGLPHGLQVAMTFDYVKGVGLCSIFSGPVIPDAQHAAACIVEFKEMAERAGATCQE